MADTVNEKSPLYVTLDFKDNLGNPYVPTTVDWRLDDIGNDTEVVGWTVLGSPAASMTLVIPGANNIIVDGNNIREERMLGIRINNGLASEGYNQYKYFVINLVAPSGP